MSERRETVDYFPEISEKCPKMKTCQKKIEIDDFERFCRGKFWIYCSENRELLRKYKRLPRDWELVQKIEGKKNE